VNIYVCVPAHDGRVDTETSRSLQDEQIAALAAGHVMQTAYLPGCSLLHHARNQMVRDFLATDCDKLVFVDSDVSGWEPGDLTRLAAKPVEVAGAAYRFKTLREDYPVQWGDTPELWADPATGLIEVRSLPGGFLSIARTAFERLAEAHPGWRYECQGGEFVGFFQMPIANGQLFCEDGFFCDAWRGIGGSIWLDPEIALTHTGRLAFKGHIGRWLKNRD
jgi:hypothetical protein